MNRMGWASDPVLEVGCTGAAVLLSVPRGAPEVGSGVGATGIDGPATFVGSTIGLPEGETEDTLVVEGTSASTDDDDDATEVAGELASEVDGVTVVNVVAVCVCTRVENTVCVTTACSCTCRRSRTCPPSCQSVSSSSSCTDQYCSPCRSATGLGGGAHRTQSNRATRSSSEIEVLQVRAQRLGWIGILDFASDVRDAACGRVLPGIRMGRAQDRSNDRRDRSQTDLGGPPGYVIACSSMTKVRR